MFISIYSKTKKADPLVVETGPMFRGLLFGLGSTFDLTNIAKQLEDKGVDLIVLEQNIDTSTTTGRLIFNMLGVIAEFETEIRKERQLSGIENAKKKGVKFGAKSKLNECQLDRLVKDREEGMP